jgi:hypothetical protein
MLSRRLALAGPAVAGLPRIADAQRRDDSEAQVIIVATAGGADSVPAAQDLVARLGGPARLHAETARGVIECAGRVNERPSGVAAILPSVALAYMTQSGLPQRTVYALRCIAQIGVSELHVLASRRIADIRDLAGQKVNLGPHGSPTEATAAVLLERISLRVDPRYLDHAQALAGVISGQIPAMMLLAPKPIALLSVFDALDAVHFLPIDEAAIRLAGLLPGQLLPADYRLTGGRPIDTAAVPLVLACFNWSASTTMFMGLAWLADVLAERGSGLRGFNMSAAVQGWQRFPPVEDWLARGRGGAISDVAPGRRQAPAAAPVPSPVPQPTPLHAAPPGAGTQAEQKAKLFQQFLEWQRRQ